MNVSELVTVNQAAELLGISRSAVYTALREGRLPRVDALGRPAILRTDLEAYRTRTSGVGPLGGRPRKARRRPGRRPRSEE